MQPFKGNSTFVFYKWGFFLFALFILCYRYYSHSMLHQLGDPVLIYPRQDRWYWLLHLLNIPKTLTQPIPSIFFDSTIFLSTLLCLFFPKKHIFCIVFTLLLMIYFMCFNSFYAHHYHNLIPVIAVSFSFWGKSLATNQILFQASRYYSLYAFGSAAVWKLIRGAIFKMDHLVSILKLEHGSYIIQNASTYNWRVALYQYLFENPLLGQFLFIGLFLMQGSFLVGFFTRRYDFLFIKILIVFLISNFLLMRMVSYEIFAIAFTLTNWNTLKERWDALTKPL